MSVAAQVGIGLVAASWLACSGAPALEVGPPGPDDEESDGKVDGASSGKVELKVTIEPSHIRRARYRVGLVNDKSQTRNVWFYDTWDLALYDAGVILRGREIDGDDDDATIKLRPFTLGELEPRFRAHDDMKCEIDRDTDSATPACSLKLDVAEGAIAGVGAYEHQARTLFDSEQEALFEAYGPDVSWYEVDPLGPVFARVWEVKSDELPDDLDAELWYMPDGGQVLELSMKVKEADAETAMQALLDFVDARDLALSAEQVSKTQRALESLAGW